MNTRGYRCDHCGTWSPRMVLGPCPSCKELSTWSVTKAPSAGVASHGGGGVAAGTPTRSTMTLAQIGAAPATRIPTGIGELDRVLGGGFVTSEVVLLGGHPGAGKALRDDTPIPTVDRGFVPIGQVDVGSTLFSSTGHPTVVVGTFHPEVAVAYRVTMSDGSSVVACEGHLWVVYDAVHGMCRRILTTRQLASMMATGDPGRWVLPALRVMPQGHKHQAPSSPSHPPMPSRDPVAELSDMPDAMFDDLLLTSGSYHRRAWVAALTHHGSRWAVVCRTGNVASRVCALCASFGVPTALSASASFTVTFAPVTYRTVSSVTPVPVHDVGFTCLAVDSPDRTFLCGKGMIPTHNSTLSLQVADRMAHLGREVLYASGEESEQQIGMRAARLGVDTPRIHVINEPALDEVCAHIVADRPGMVVVDSLQTMSSPGVSGTMGSLAQSKAAAGALHSLAKQQGIIMVLVNQIVKSGEFSSSESIQHIVDATLMMTSDNDSPLKFLRAAKNRFGSVDEVGVFQHADCGLEEVSDPSGILLDTPDAPPAGSSYTFSGDGVRQIPVEVQALVVPSPLPTPRRQFNGVDVGRAQIVCAILDKFCDAQLFDNDVFVSTVSGVKVRDPMSDMAVAAAVMSSLRGVAIPARTALIGELSLTGQVRGSFMVDAKVAEAARLGFTTVGVPSRVVKGVPHHPGVRVVGLDTVADVSRLIR